MAKGTCKQEITQFSQASNTRRDCYWPCQEKKLLSDQDQDTPSQTSQHPQQCASNSQRVQTDADIQQQGGSFVYVPIANIEDQLKVDALVLCHEGSANMETVYVQAWKSIRSQLNHKFSHIFLKCKQVSSYTRKLCLQARWGLLPHNKNLNRWNNSISSSCPLCGEEDGGHHAISACKGLSKTATIRHNNAGSKIVLAIRKGRRGGELVTSDVGLSARVAADELQAQALVTKRKFTSADLLANPTLAQNIPQDMWEILTQTLQDSHSIPDALLYRRVDRREYYSHIFTIVEIKYCRDTKPEDQWARATEQHQALADSLRGMKGHDETQHIIEVEQVNIMLGVAGSIYNETVATLTKLGVTGGQLDELLTGLHHTAVEGVELMWKHRQAAVSNLPHAQHTARIHSKRKRQTLYRRGNAKPGGRSRRNSKCLRVRDKPLAAPPRTEIANKKRAYNQREPDHRKHKRARAVLH